jgi:hypothetical protein
MQTRTSLAGFTDVQGEAAEFIIAQGFHVIGFCAVSPLLHHIHSK